MKYSIKKIIPLANITLTGIFLFISPILLFVNTSLGGSCDCSTDMDFVVKYYEANLPGYVEDVNKINRNRYEKLKANLKALAFQARSKSECFKLLISYVEFFQDNHSTIYNFNKSINENNTDLLNEFLTSEPYQSSENYSLKDTDLKQYPLGDIRGIYQTSDETYKIVIIPNKGNFRKFIGVVVESKTKLWKKGQVKIELNPNKKGGFEAFSYTRNHSLSYFPNYKLQDGILGDVWFKTTLVTKVSQNVNASNDLEFKIFNGNIAYLRIPSFSGNQTAKIYNFYQKYQAEIAALPYLIIDVRNNGGGSDRNVEPLLKYLYTKPFQEDQIELYVTEGNIKAWEEQYEIYRKDKLNYSEDYIREAKIELDRMRKAPLNSFLLRNTESQTIDLGSVLALPRRVAIITNKNCASSCETLLFWAKESDKTIIVGENSGGYVGYGEVGNVETPCYKFSLSCTKTRYKKQRRFEVTGIPPNYVLDNKSDWVQQTIKLLVKF